MFIVIFCEVIGSYHLPVALCADYGTAKFIVDGSEEPWGMWVPQYLVPQPGTPQGAYEHAAGYHE